jgi:fibronectin-binding autotransporter adhesin
MATKTWDGGAASDFWSLADNWDATIPPSPGDDILIEAGFGTTIFNGSIPLASLSIDTLNSASNLTVSEGSLNVTGAATLADNLAITAGTLTLDGTSSVTTFS